MQVFVELEDARRAFQTCIFEMRALRRRVRRSWRAAPRVAAPRTTGGMGSLWSLPLPFLQFQTHLVRSTTAICDLQGLTAFAGFSITAATMAQLFRSFSKEKYSGHTQLKASVQRSIRGEH